MIDPKAQAVIDATNMLPPMNVLGVEASRQLIASRPTPAKTPVREIVDLDADGVPIRLYRPETANVLPGIVFAHGGGWILGSIESTDETCRRMAVHSGCAVISVEYRLAPEARHPAAVDDMLKVMRWLSTAAAGLGIDVTRLAISGESSGAHVAVAASIAMTGLAGYPRLAAQLLVCPPINRRMATQTWKELGEAFIPRRSQMAWMWDLYLGENDEFTVGAPDPANADLRGLPATLIVVAEYDPLREEAEEFGNRLVQSNVATTVTCCAGQVHPVFGYAPIIPECSLSTPGRRSNWTTAAQLGRKPWETSSCHRALDMTCPPCSVRRSHPTSKRDLISTARQ